MPDSDELEPSNQPDGTDDTTEQAPAAPAPQYVTLEEFRAQQAQLSQLNETLAALRDMAARPVAPAPAPVAAPVEAEITRAQYIAAVREGDVEVAERYLAQREGAVSRTLSQRIDQLENVGTAALSEVHRDRISGLKHYKKYEKEIQQVVDGLPPAMRAQSGAYQYAYRIVVGTHLDEIEAAAREEALRKPTIDEANESPAGGGGRTGRQMAKGAANSIPTPFDLGGDGAVAAMEVDGRDADTVAKKLGYKDWRDYMTKTAEYR